MKLMGKLTTPTVMLPERARGERVGHFRKTEEEMTFAGRNAAWLLSRLPSDWEGKVMTPTVRMPERARGAGRLGRSDDVG